MMKKHFLLGTVSSFIALTTSLSAVLVFGQLPDTTTPVHFLIESGLAKKLGIMPTENEKAVDVKSVIDDLTSTNNVFTGLVFKGDADMSQLLSADMVSQLQTDVGADSFVYIGQKPTMTGDNDIGDGEICVLAVGKQAFSVLTQFEAVGDSTTLSTDQVKSMLLDLTVYDVGFGKVSQKSATAGAEPELAEA